MANLLDKYENTTDEMVVPASESAGKAKQQPALSRKERKILKALAKALRKHNKLMKQEAERRRAEEEATEKANRRKDDSSTRGFFNKLGDAICKAIPKVLTAIATVALGFFFNRKPSRRALRAAL